jgi:hypothetical protein
MRGNIGFKKEVEFVENDSKLKFDASVQIEEIEIPSPVFQKDDEEEAVCIGDKVTYQLDKGDSEQREKGTSRNPYRESRELICLRQRESFTAHPTAPLCQSSLLHVVSRKRAFRISLC